MSDYNFLFISSRLILGIDALFLFVQFSFHFGWSVHMRASSFHLFHHVGCVCVCACLCMCVGEWMWVCLCSCVCMCANMYMCMCPSCPSVCVFHVTHLTWFIYSSIFHYSSSNAPMKAFSKRNHRNNRMFNNIFRENSFVILMKLHFMWLPRKWHWWRWSDLIWTETILFPLTLDLSSMIPVAWAMLIWFYSLVVVCWQARARSLITRIAPNAR